MANTITADVKLRVQFDQNGMPTAVVQAGGAGGAGAGQAPGQQQGVMPPGGFGGLPAPVGTNIGQMGSMHRLAMGGSALPWWLDPSNPAGSAGRAMASANLDPMMSGAEQLQINASQGARAAVAGFGNTGLGQATGAIATGGGDAEAYWAGIADMIGASIEKAFDKVAKTGAAATQTAQGVVAKFARAGVEVADDDIKSLLDRELKKEEADYDARVRVAEHSGNMLGGVVNRGQNIARDILRGSLEERLEGVDGISNYARSELIDAIDTSFQSGQPSTPQNTVRKSLDDALRARARATDGGS